MNAWEYTVISVMYDGPGQDGHTGYGLAVKTPEDTITVTDIFTEYNDAARLANLFNRLQLSPVHIWDAIEDAIA